MITRKAADDYFRNIFGIDTKTFVNPFQALVFLINNDLKFGGVILTLKEDHCSLDLNSPMITGISVWTGPKDEMRPIFMYLQMYAALGRDNDFILHTASLTVANWADLKRTGEVFLAENRLALMLMVAVGLRKPDEYRVGFSVDYDDILVPAIELLGEGASFLDLVTPHVCATCKKQLLHPVSSSNRHALAIMNCTAEGIEDIVMDPKQRHPLCVADKDWESIYS